MSEVVSYVIYDDGDNTYHHGEGEWAQDRLGAVHYETADAAQKDLEDCDQGELLRHRLNVLPEGIALSDPLHLMAVLSELALIRDTQDRQWGGTVHDDHNEPWDWVAYITKSLGRSIVYPPTTKRALVSFRQELMKVAAIAVAAAQSIDRKLEGDILTTELRRVK
jgi:hypothetical protein